MISTRLAENVKGDDRKDSAIPIDISAMKWLRGRLDIEDIGRLAIQVSRAASAKRPSELQRLVLKLLEYRGAL